MIIEYIDSSQALLADYAQIDTVLVGDSCANVMMGLKNTNQITLDAIIHHTQSVSRSLNRAYLIADMPFGTYLTTNGMFIFVFSLLTYILTGTCTIQMLFEMQLG